MAKVQYMGLHVRIFTIKRSPRLLFGEKIRGGDWCVLETCLFLYYEIAIFMSNISLGKDMPVSILVTEAVF